jgi:hypothetical protein
MKSLTKLIWKILNAIGIGGAIQLLLNGYLVDKGWFSSFSKKQAIDAQGNALPWLTYPFIYFIAPRLSPEILVFEYGAGNSTLWFMKKVKHVRSVEHDKTWFSHIQSNIVGNCKVTFQEDSIDGSYAREVLQDKVKYDLILVDANDRFHCALYATEALSSSGVIVLDNAERIEYKPIYEMLSSKGFKYIDFEGLSPGVQSTNVTTIFYRNDNCLGI